MLKESLFSIMPLEAIEQEAAKLGCLVVIAQPNQLQFDLDTEEDYLLCKKWIAEKLEPRYQQVVPVEEWRSRSNHWHIVVTVPAELGVVERIALQTQGHSDHGREFAALCCHWDGSQNPILLFKPITKAQTPEVGKYEGER